MLYCPNFFGMCCRSEWQERMYIYKWHEVDQTKHEIFCVHIVCNEIQVKVNLEITTFFFYLHFPYCPNFFWFGVVYIYIYIYSIYIYIYISGVKRLIAINCIQNISFSLHNICLCTVYIYYVYSAYRKSSYPFLFSHFVMLCYYVKLF